MMDGPLETLIIDDSPTDAQMLSYLLTKRLGCRVEVVHDGVQGLDRLSSRKFDLVFLDLLMPLMSGMEVLQEIRGYAETADLPIVVISGVADPRTVRTLLQLKVLDYIIKPYHAEMIVRRLSEKLAGLRARLKPPSVKLTTDEESRDDDRQVVLVADGDANFRHFCSETLGNKFRVLLAANGAQALAMAMKFAPAFLFAGSRLGAFDRDRMVAKLRQTPELAKLRIFAVTTDGQSGNGSTSLYDAFIRRTFVADAFMASTERWLSAAGLHPAAAESIEHLREALLSATEQVFGMMMSEEVCVDDHPPPIDPSSVSTYGIIRLASFAECRRLAITFRAGQASVRTMSMRMLHIEQERSAEAVDLAHSSLAEVLNIIAGRINNSLDEEGREFCIGFPSVEERTSTDGDDSSGGFTISFAAGENIHFSIALSMDRLPRSRVAASALTDAMVLADQVDLGGGAKLPKGLKLNREHIGNIEKARLEDVEVFDPF
jgi:CheY-like chemotaxis protein